jgi:hypothetical protein
VIREPQRKYPRLRMTVRVLLVLVFVLVASLTPLAIGRPRMALDPVTAAVSMVLSLLFAAAIWWI